MNDTAEDVLIARIVDQLDAPDDWRALDRLAQADGAVWGRVLTTLRAECHVRHQGAELLAASANVDLPLAGEPAARLRGRARRRTTFRRGGAGLAAAAAVLVAFLLGRGLGGDSSAEPLREPLASASPAPQLVAAGGESAADAEARVVEESLAGAWGTYLDAARREGVFVREMTPVVLETRPNPDGEGYEVTFLRGVVQRDLVDSVYEVGVDEQGRPLPVPVDANNYVQLTSF